MQNRECIVFERTRDTEQRIHEPCANRRAFSVRMRHPLNDNSVGTSNLMAGNRKLAWSFSPFKGHFVGALNTTLSYKKMLSMTKMWRFLRAFSVVDFSAVGFLDFLKTQRQKSLFLHKSDFHWQSNAFLWFDFQTHGFSYQGRNASE